MKGILGEPLATDFTDAQSDSVTAAIVTEIDYSHSRFSATFKQNSS